MESDDLGIVLAVLSVILGLIGVFYFGIFLGPPALILGIVALSRHLEDLVLEPRYKLLAGVGIVLGIAELVIAIIGLAGIGS